MSMRRPNFRRRRKLTWALFGTGAVSLAASAAVAADLTTLILGQQPSLNNFTLVRVRALFGVRPISTTPTARFYDAGMTWVTDAAFSAGALPDPENDDVSWLWHSGVPWSPGNTAETSAGTFTTNFSMLEVDTKSMRRIDEQDQALVLVVKNRQATTSEFFLEGRALLRLT